MLHRVSGDLQKGHGKPVVDKAVNAEMQATFVMKKTVCMCISKIDTEREREREREREMGTKRTLYCNSNNYKE